MKDKSKLTAIILIIVTIIVVILSTILNKKEFQKEEEQINIVTNYSSFYTVNSCIYRLVTYLYSKDSNNLLLLLDDKYEEKNNINSENVLDEFPKVEFEPTFVSNKMYYETLTKDITKYYVKGYIEENQISDNFETEKSNRIEVYFIIYIDSSQKIFSVEPYSGDIFMDGELNEK